MRAKRVSLAVLLFLLLLTSCSFTPKQPEWVLQNPVDNAYYQAVTHLSKKVPAYGDLARENALREISSQISVQIDSDIALTETEANGIPSSDLISQIRSSSRNKLSGVQLAGVYQTDKDYWAYYRLSKSEFRSWRIQQRNLALQQATNLLSEFDSSSNDIAAGITSLLKAMELIIDFTDMDLSCQYQGKEVNLYNEVFNRLQRLPASLKPSYAIQQLALVAKTRSTNNVTVTMQYQKGTQLVACSAFPLSFGFSRGAGEIVKTAVTQSDGKAELIIHRITDFVSLQQIALTPDKDYWLGRIENPVVKRLFSQLQFPPALLTLLVSRPKAFLGYSFDNTKGSAYRDIITKKLQDLDLEVVADSSLSDFSFRIRIISHEGDFVPRLNLYAAQADAYVELLNSKSKTSIYNANLTNIKSTGNSLEAARKMCELNAVNEICNKLMYMLVEQYIMR